MSIKIMSIQQCSWLVPKFLLAVATAEHVDWVSVVPAYCGIWTGTGTVLNFQNDKPTCRPRAVCHMRMRIVLFPSVFIYSGCHLAQTSWSWAAFSFSAFENYGSCTLQTFQRTSTSPSGCYRWFCIPLADGCFVCFYSCVLRIECLLFALSAWFYLMYPKTMTLNCLVTSRTASKTNTSLLWF